MKALSIKQPWAWLIIHGGKDVENRTWPTKFRGEFLVHASQSVDADAYHHLLKQGIKSPPYVELERGKIIGSVELIDCDPLYNSYWKQSGSYGFVLRNPKPCRPVQYKGQLNFFEVPEKELNVNFKSVFEGV